MLSPKSYAADTHTHTHLLQLLYFLLTHVNAQYSHMSLPTAMKSPKLNVEVPMLLQSLQDASVSRVGRAGGGEEETMDTQKKT